MNGFVRMIDFCSINVSKVNELTQLHLENGPRTTISFDSYASRYNLW